MDCKFIIANNEKGWWKASKAQIKTYKDICKKCYTNQFLAGCEEGKLNGYKYKINQYGIWLQTSDGFYREMREIDTPKKPPG